MTTLHIRQRIRSAENIFGRRIPVRAASVNSGMSGRIPRYAAEETAMPRVTMVRYTTKPDRAAENEALSRAVFTEIHQNKPAGIAYGLFKEPDGTSFVHLFINLEDDSSDAVTELPTFKAFEKSIRDRCVAPPAATRMTVALVDSYGLK
ncbi:MAG TPA: hypothetical protein VIV09_13190 [Pseudolabrys sp.]|jgi:hypothetical protein